MIKALTVQDAPSIFAYLSDLSESPDIYFPRAERVVDTVKWILQMKETGILAYVIYLDGLAAGVVTYKPTKNKDEYQIGFYFKVSARGHIFKYVQHTLEHLPVEWVNIIATPYPKNIRSAKFLAKLGFEFIEHQDRYDLWERGF